MKKAPIPGNESSRLKCLLSMNVLDSAQEDRYDRITRIAKNYFKVPIALVSLVDANRQWFKSKQGLSVNETPRDISFCGHAIVGSQVFYVPDTLKDERFNDNPLVIGGPKIRFYAGIPLSGKDGSMVGTLCVIDSQPRVLDEKDFAVLRDLGACVESELLTSAQQVMSSELRLKASRLSIILESIDDAVVVTDGNGLIDTLSIAGKKMFGYEVEEVLGQNIQLFFSKSSRDSFINMLNMARESKNTNFGNAFEALTGVREDGSLFPIEVCIKVKLIHKHDMVVIIIRDIEKRNKEEMIRSLYTAIIEDSSDAILSKTVDGIITSWNKASEKIFGYKAEEVIGKPMALLIPPELSEQEPEILSKIKKGVRIDHFDTIRVAKNGKPINVSVSISPIKDRYGKIIGASKIVRDITERLLLETQKKEFISTVSHELRTPLTSIKGSLGLIKSGVVGVLPEKLQKMLDIAYNNSERLITIINDILDMEKISSGKMEFKMESIDLSELVEEAIKANEGYAQQHDVKLICKNKIPHVHVHGDTQRLLQVFANLISNAVKYSSKNDVVKLSAQIKNNVVRVEVKDSGPGIPQNFRDKIFKKFSQADSADTRKKGGTGLGLSISKEIIEKHGGTIGYISNEGGGALFYFELPELKIQEIHKMENNRPENSMLALVCEDDPDFASLLKEVLQNEGFLVDVVGTAKKAEALLMKMPYTLMTLDIGLPDESGILLIKKLSKKRTLDYLPIIVISGVDKNLKSELNGDAITIIDWLEKPIDMSKLIDTLKKVTRADRDDKVQILHVEDDVENFNIVSEIVSDYANIDSAVTIKEARKKLTEKHYDLLILDLILPDGDGQILFSDITALGPKAPLIVVFSAKDFQANGSINVFASLMKSYVTNQQLSSTIQSAIRRIKKQKDD